MPTQILISNINILSIQAIPTLTYQNTCTCLCVDAVLACRLCLIHINYYKPANIFNAVFPEI